MARLPGIEELGPAPRVDPARPIADISAGGAALAQAGEQLGKGIAKLGEGAGELALDRNRWDYAKAHSFLLTGISDRDAATAADANYGPDETGKSLPNRHADQISSLRDQAAGMIADPRMRERFLMVAGPTMQRSLERGTAHAKGLENNANVAWVTEQADNTINLGVKSPDEETRRGLLDGQNQLIDGLVQKGAIQATQAAAMKRDFAHHYATADYLHAVNSNDPAQIEAAIARLRSEPGSPADITGRILQIEGTGKNARSSAQGPGQFTDETWVNILKTKRPDLADGRSDQELLALRADKGLAKDMTEANRADNQAYLEKRNIAATPGAQYLAHFLGPAGAAAVLKADPNKPVADVLAQAVGKTKAAAMIEANPEILTGKLAGSVAQWADTKMGGGHIHEVLRLKPDEREQLIAHGEAALAKYNVTDLAGFKTRIEDTTAEAMRTGGVTKPIERGEFVQKLGAESGGKAYEQYNANIQLGRDVEALKRLDPGEQMALLKSYEPVAGETNYADNVKRHAALTAAIQKLNKERGDDPAAFAIQRLPTSGEAFKTFSGVMSDAGANDDARSAAARTYATTTLMEQGRIGIPPDQRRVVPQSYIDNLTSQLNDPKSAGGTVNVVNRLQREAQIWGEHWPQVYRQLGAEGGPTVRVIGSGVQPTAGRILAELASVKLPDILKDENAEKAGTIKKDVLEAFKPLAGSLAGNEGMISVFNDFRGQAEKLAAYYVVRGATSSDAAAQAFKELVGHKYDFVVGRESGLFSGIPSAMSFRLPKAAGLTVPQAVAGAKEASVQLGTMDLAPARDTVGGLSAEYLKRETVRAYQRDGIWTTAPDESGVMLVYKDQAVRRADGKPLIVPWAELTKLGEQGAKRQENSERRYLELGMPRG